jgi:monoamine oxidase
MSNCFISPGVGKSTMLLLLSAYLSSYAFASVVPESVDVAIIGAGLSGLTTARDLLHGGKSVVVLEARDRVGGKVYNHPLKNGGVTEVGAEFVGPTQDKVLQMISDLGLETFDTYNEGKTILWRNNTRLTYTPDPQLGGAPPVEQASLLEVAGAQGQLNAWAAELNTSAPWMHPKAEELDSMTFQQFIDQQATLSDTSLVLTTACKAIFAAEPRELSLLYVVAYIAAAGNETAVGTLDRLTAIKDGAQEKRVVGGTGLIPERLAKKVGSEHIILNAAVSTITKTRKSYKVVSRAGTVHAKEVVVAMAPPLLRQITFSPPLPTSRQQLNQKMKMASIGKGIPIYSTPFWRHDNLSAQVLSDSGSVKITFDSTPEDTSFGAILGFILGDEMRALDKLTPAQCEKKLLADYKRYFGDSGTNITEFVLQRWDLEEWSRGGPVAVAPPNVLTQYGSALRAKVDGLHFAGTETSPYWTGYMDGAIRSGERAAKEILEH